MGRALTETAQVPRGLHGFSLVELSIVLVILGLLTGGILSGQSLIRAAELRAVTTEYARVTAAAHSFRDRYFALPGDFRDATKFWGYQVNGSGCTTNSSQAVTANGVCDGNGDGRVRNASAGGTSGEMFQFWRHLAAAGLVEGTYTGIAGANAFNGTRDNSMSSRLQQAVWTSIFRVVAEESTASNLFFDFTSQNTLQIGGPRSSGSAYASIMKPEEVWNIDTKIDDGKPGRGKVNAVNYLTCTTATATDQFDSEYLLTSSSIGCSAVFLSPY